MSNKKVLMLLQSEFPPDIRLEKEIKSLNYKGFSVTLFCNQFGSEEKKDFPYCKIIRMPVLTKNKKLNKILNFPAVFNFRMVWQIIKTFFNVKPQVVHVHDLPMLPFGVILKLIRRTHLIFDMHENYPAALKSYKKSSIIERIVKNHWLAQKVENLLMKYVDKVIVVTEENKNRLLQNGVSEQKIVLVSNTVDLSQFAVPVAIPDYLKKYEKNFVLVYSGRISLNRGLDTPIQALKYLKQNIPSIKLLIVGEGSYLETLKNLAESEGVADIVEFVKWPGHENIKYYISLANICLVPQPSNEHADTTVPHKLFEYMAEAKPILVSDASPLKRIISETKAGEYFISNNPKSFAEKIIEMNSSPENYGKNGRVAVEEKYNWKVDSKRLIDLYLSLTEK